MWVAVTIDSGLSQHGGLIDEWLLDYEPSGWLMNGCRCNFGWIEMEDNGERDGRDVKSGILIIMWNWTLKSSGSVHHLDPRALRPLHGGLPLQPLLDWGPVQGDGRQSLCRSLRNGRWTQGNFLPPHRHDQGGPAAAHRWPLPVQGRWSLPPGNVGLWAIES